MNQSSLNKLLEEADFFLERRNLKQAEQLYTDLIDKSKHCDKIKALAFNNRGQAKYFRVDFDGAIEDFTKSILLCSDLHMAYYNRGLIHYRMARYQKAIEDFESALKSNPTFEDAKVAIEVAKKDFENLRK